MCGRFSFSPVIRIIEERFDVKVDKTQYKPRYNCAPTQNLAVITNREPCEMKYFRWGLIPFWAKDPSIGSRMINAKAETIREKPSFRIPFLKQRCLVPADGFYEWKRAGSKEKIPYRITLADRSPFAMAGIWDRWKDPEGRQVYSFAILTTAPNELLSGIHNRMPVILSRDQEKAWISDTDPAELKSMLEPFPAEDMNAYTISKKVNYPGNDTPEILEEVSY